RLGAGDSPESIARQDSAQGIRYIAVRELTEGQTNDYKNILFEELGPGKSTKVARSHGWVVLHVIERRTPRPLDYGEVLAIIDESVQNEEAERQLDAFTARLRRKHKIAAHPELVMRLSLTDPQSEWRL